MSDRPSTRSQRKASELLEERDGIVHRRDGLKHLETSWAAAFLGLVNAGNALDRRLDSELEVGHRIGLRAFEILLYLAVFSEDGSLSMAELNSETPLSQSRTSRVVADLERQGLVERSQSATDGRGVTVAITPDGVDRFRAAQETHLAGLNTYLFSHLSDTDIRRLGRITTRILETLDES